MDDTERGVELLSAMVIMEIAALLQPTIPNRAVRNSCNEIMRRVTDDKLKRSLNLIRSAPTPYYMLITYRRQIEHIADGKVTLEDG